MAKEIFTFKKEYNKFRWESDFMALEFSNPSIQGFSEFVHLKSEEDILHYYYNVKIFKKITIDWDDNNKEIMQWELVSERSTYDFPTILQLKWILEYQLKDNTMLDGQKIEYIDGDVRYSKVMSTGGIACDDFYDITKIVDSEGKDFCYIVYVGVTFDVQGDLNSTGIKTPYVYKEDIEKLLKCVVDFIQYSIDETNKKIDAWKDAYRIKNNKIYRYDLDENGIIEDSIESIYAVGDSLEITTIINNKEVDYDEAVISIINEDNIVLDDGDIIALESIAFLSHIPADERLNYNEDEIAQEFKSILSDEEKEEFIKCSTEFLLNKYKMCIINRTEMCMDEHKFNIDYTSGDRVELVTPIVKNIINIIKSSLMKENN